MTNENNGIGGAGESATNGPWDPGGELWNVRQRYRAEEQLQHIRTCDGHPQRPDFGIELYDRKRESERIVQRVMRDGTKKSENLPRQMHTEYTLDIQDTVSKTEVAICVKYETDTYLDSEGNADAYGDHLVVTDAASKETLFERKGGTVTTKKEGPWEELFPLF